MNVSNIFLMSKSDLWRLYVQEKKTGVEIAKIYGVDKKTVFNALKRKGIGVRVGCPPSKATMTTKEMRVLYENGRTVDELAKEAGICPSSVIGRFRRIGFRLRTAIFTRIKAAPNLDHLSFVDRSYLAGLIDGEGCIGLHWDINTGTFRPYVTITNTNKPVLQWAKRTLGIGFISMNERKNLGYKNAYKIEFKRLAEIPALLYSILPFIKIKRKQTLALAMFCERRIERAKNGKGYSRGDHKLYRLLKRLNQKGVA